MSTYAEFQTKSSSQKIGLCTVDASERLVDFTLESGSIYRVDNFTRSVLLDVENNGVDLTEVSSLGAVVPGTYFHDRSDLKLYLELADSSDPTDLIDNFIGIEFRLFFATEPVIAPHDLSTGFDVEWLPLMVSGQGYGVELDNLNQIGFAVEGKGDVRLFNDKSFWAPIFDKFVWNNKKVFVYSWGGGLAITEARLIYRGRITERSWSGKQITFRLKDALNELRAEVSLPFMSSVSGALIPTGLSNARQRRFYGALNGVRPTNIDQIVDGYPQTGTITVTSGSDTLTGSGTSFLTNIAPGDELVVAAPAGVEDDIRVAILSVQSDTSATLDAEFDGIVFTAQSFTLVPARDKKFINRDHFLSGDELGEFTTTIASVTNASAFTFNSTVGLKAGDPLVINGAERSIRQVSGSFVRLEQNLPILPAVNDSVTRPSVYNVRINNRLLQRTRDYTIPATNDRIELTEEAEFNLAPIRSISGTVTFNILVRNVTGSGTDFLRDVRPGDFIAATGEVAFFQVLQVNSATSLDLTEAATYTAAGVVGRVKSPNFYTEGEDVLSCSLFGTTTTKLKAGGLIDDGPDAILDLLKSGGLTSDLLESSFTEASDIAEARVGIAIPSTFDATSSPSIRSIIDKVNESIFGAIVQNNDFKLELQVLRPFRTLASALTLDETDILKFNVKSSSKRTAKAVRMSYDSKEYDPSLGAPSAAVQTAENRNGKFLARTENVFDRNSVLVSANDASILASRFAFLVSIASSIITLSTKLQASQIKATDVIQVSHPELYDRIGSTDKRKIAAVQSVTKSELGATIEIEDLSNAFSRVATITANTANNFGNASTDEKAYDGYITANDGLVENESQTNGINVIW